MLKYLVVSLCASSASAQHAHIAASGTWSEVITGTTNPVANPNGVLEPGESAWVKVSLEFTPVGTPVAYTFPPPGGVAPIAGLHYSIFSLATAQAPGGSWSHLSTSAGFVGELGIVVPEGLLLARLEQPDPTPGSFPLATNPLVDCWRVVWTPQSYAQTTVTFDLAPSSHSSGILFVHTGQGPSGPTFADHEAFPTTWGEVPIPIIPAPAAVLWLGLGLMSVRARRDIAERRVGI